MRIFFSAGEPSGDLHGANLIRALRQARPDIECVGYGGPQMADAGCHLHADLTALAVMWFLRVLVNLHKFLDLASRADRYFRHQRPDAVVLIDYPGFNWWIARRAKAHGIPVFYYAPPQIWAWASWRVRKMRRLVDHVLCSLEFERKWFSRHGCRATFVGHPYFDEVHQQQLDEQFMAECKQPGQPLVTLLPGSRTQEVEHNLRMMLSAAQRMAAQVPQARFAIASFKPQQAEFARRLVAETQLPIAVHVGRTPELIAAADCCLAVSGSVSLELLYYARPTVIVYRISRVMYWLQEKVRRVRYITLVNLLDGEAIFRDEPATMPGSAVEPRQALFPEYLTCEDCSAAVADQLVEWLTNDTARQERQARLVALRERVAEPGAARRAAEYILRELTNDEVSLANHGSSDVSLRGDTRA